MMMLGLATSKQAQEIAGREILRNLGASASLHMMNDAWYALHTAIVCTVYRMQGQGLPPG